MAPRSLPSDAAARRAITTLLLSGSLLLAGCQRGPSLESQRIDQLELKIQQLEQRLNKAVARPDPADKAGKPPAGPVKSLTFRTGTDDDRLRIYWGDGTSTDLPCTREQATYVCG
jgi:outer membrane murein-binding lipoprotein Lpp